MEISPIRPEPYGERFLNYICKVTKSPEEAAAEVVPNAQSRTNSYHIPGIDRSSILDREQQNGTTTDNADPRKVLSTIRSPSTDRGGIPGQTTLPVVEELGEASSTGGRSAASREREEIDERPRTPMKDYSPSLVGSGRKTLTRTSLDKDLPPLPPAK